MREEILDKCIPATTNASCPIWWDRELKKFVVFNETWSDTICAVDTFAEAQEVFKKYCEEYL